MKKILLIDVDSKIPNIALMKISGFYKDKGYHVSLYRLGGNAYKRLKKAYVNAKDFEIVFISIVFKSNKESVIIDGCDKVYYGGTGYDLKVKLPQEIDSFKEDYSIYPENDKSYGFITRGCIRHCYFCVVPEKEGPIHKYREINQIIQHKTVVFLDNNILAHDDCKGILKELVDKNIHCQFNQGLDIRLVDDEIAKLLSRLNYIGEYTFAFDDIRLMDLINVKLAILKKYIKKDWEIRFYLYCNTIDNVFNRINWCKKNRCLPYIMRDESIRKDGFITQIAAWCNQPSFFKNMGLDEFITKRSLSKDSKEKYIKECLNYGQQTALYKHGI